MTDDRNDGPRPPICMTESESARLTELALEAEARHPAAAGMLLEEIARARLCGDDELPPDTVAMLSTVEFADARNGTTRTVQLVYPADADIDAGRISILTPVGAGLIGLRAGQSIAWPDRDGKTRALRVLGVARARGAAR